MLKPLLKDAPLKKPKKGSPICQGRPKTRISMSHCAVTLRLCTYSHVPNAASLLGGLQQTDMVSSAQVYFRRMRIPQWSFCNPFPSRAKKTFPPTFSNASPDHSQPPPPLQCWLDWRVCLKREWNVFFARRNFSHGGAANDQHCIIWGCGGGVLPKTEGTFFSLGRTPPRL